MRTVKDVEARLDKARREYLSEVAACDRELQGIVRVDPVHLKAAKTVQGAFDVSVDRLELKANEQPPEPKKAKK